MRIAKVQHQVDRLAAEDADKLARFYATFAVRQLRWRVPFASKGMEIPSWTAHYQYAKQAHKDVIKWELASRIEQIAARFG